MSTLTEQLREALEDYERCSDDWRDSAYVASKTMDILPQLLDEHERLEREAEVSRAFIERVIFLEKTLLNNSPELTDAISAYRTACEK